MSVLPSACLIIETVLPIFMKFGIEHAGPLRPAITEVTFAGALAEYFAAYD
jgi:hypothetical protein